MKRDNLLILLIFFFLLTILFPFKMFSYAPIITKNDYVFQKSDSGYELYIRKKKNIGSILLTESQKDPSLTKTNYGLRTGEYFAANGDEIRILNDKILHTKYDVFFLVDSTTENHEILGDSFRYFLPEKVYYGYEWSRKGELEIKNGIRLNLRIFEKPYADYSGNFHDQWIKLELQIREEIYRERLPDNFNEITEKVHLIDEDNTLEDVLKKIPDEIENAENGHLIFLIDTTSSMAEEFPVFRKQFRSMIKEINQKIKDLSVGFVLYRDYGENYVTKRIDLSNDYDYFESLLSRIRLTGGQDIPEAVHEAMYEFNNFKYTSSNRIAYLIGDAPAHKTPRHKITKEDAMDAIKKNNIKIKSICLPYQ